MKKRVCAAFFALLLIGKASCPPAWADGPLEPVEGGTLKQPLTPTPSDTVIPETEGEPGNEMPTSEPSPDPELSKGPPQESPQVEITPEPAPEHPPNELPPEVTPTPPEDDGCNTIEKLIAQDGAAQSLSPET